VETSTDNVVINHVDQQMNGAILGLFVLIPGSQNDVARLDSVLANQLNAIVRQQ
jgi:hypothetical protein